jgi:Fe-Mn family superoxide dismutase
LLVAAAAGAAPAPSDSKSGEAGPVAPAFAGRHAVVPLPFDPKKLNGLSEKMIVSHHDNNYAGAVKNLNKVENELGGVTKDTPPFVVSGLKERELTFSNSLALHQLYFGNLGGGGHPSAAFDKRLSASYGSAARWEEHFRAVGASLGGGSGWALLEWDLMSGGLRTSWSSGHSQSPALVVPVLVMDMYEHAYALDYGAAAGKYIDAFFKNVNWEEVDRRVERAEKASAALRA